MSATLTATPAAGWYPDPGGSEGWRWWDGATWTSHVRPMEHTAPVAVVAHPATGPQQFVEPATAGAPLPVSEPERAPVSETAPGAPAQPVTLTPATPASEQIYWHSAEAEVIRIPGRSATSMDAVARRNAAGGGGDRIHIWGEVGSPQTAGIWLLASVPLLSIVVQVLLATTFGIVQGTTGVATNIPSIAIGAIVLIAQWVFAGLDIKVLRSRGYEPPSIFWMLLLPPLVYFIQRGKVVRREGKRAWPPELLYFLSVIGIIGISVAYVALIITLMGGLDGLLAMAGAGVQAVAF